MNIESNFEYLWNPHTIAQVNVTAGQFQSQPAQPNQDPIRCFPTLSVPTHSDSIAVSFSKISSCNFHNTFHNLHEHIQQIILTSTALFMNSHCNVHKTTVSLQIIQNQVPSPPKSFKEWSVLLKQNVFSLAVPDMSVHSLIPHCQRPAMWSSTATTATSTPHSKGGVEGDPLAAFSTACHDWI